MSNRKFVCKEPGCRRSDPFGSKADLTRHHCGAHGKKLDGTPARRYRCPMQECSRSMKPFKRKDRLRDHLLQLHSVSDYPLQNCVVSDPATSPGDFDQPQLPSLLSSTMPLNPWHALSSGVSGYEQNHMEVSTTRNEYREEAEQDSEDDIEDDQDEDDDVCHSLTEMISVEQEMRRKLEVNIEMINQRIQTIDEKVRGATSSLRRHRRDIRRRRTGGPHSSIDGRQACTLGPSS